MATLEPARSRRDRLRDRITSLRRAVLRRRRVVAAACAAAAVAAGLHAAVPPDPTTVAVLGAARDLPAGATLGSDDLELLHVRPDVVPDGALTRHAEAVGDQLAAPLRAREVLTDARLVGPALTGAAAGSVALPVRLSDAAQAGLLTVGDEIDLLATDPETRTTTHVADDIVVLAVPNTSADAPDALTGRLVVVGVAPTDVAEVTGAAVTSFVTYAWRRR